MRVRSLPGTASSSRALPRRRGQGTHGSSGCAPRPWRVRSPRAGQRRCPRSSPYACSSPSSSSVLAGGLKLCDQFGERVYLCLREIRLLVLGEHLEQKDRPLIVVVVVDEPRAPAFATALERNPQLPNTAGTGNEIARPGVSGNHLNHGVALVLAHDRASSLGIVGRLGYRDHSPQSTSLTDVCQ